MSGRTLSIEEIAAKHGCGHPDELKRFSELAKEAFPQTRKIGILSPCFSGSEVFSRTSAEWISQFCTPAAHCVLDCTLPDPFSELTVGPEACGCCLILHAEVDPDIIDRVRERLGQILIIYTSAIPIGGGICFRFLPDGTDTCLCAEMLCRRNQPTMRRNIGGPLPVASPMLITALTQLGTVSDMTCGWLFHDQRPDIAFMIRTGVLEHLHGCIRIPSCNIPYIGRDAFLTDPAGTDGRKSSQGFEMLLQRTYDSLKTKEGLVSVAADMDTVLVLLNGAAQMVIDEDAGSSERTSLRGTLNGLIR